MPAKPKVKRSNSISKGIAKEASVEPTFAEDDGDSIARRVVRSKARSTSMPTTCEPKEDGVWCKSIAYTCIGLAILAAALVLASNASTSTATASPLPPYKGACGCFDPASSGKLLKALSIRTKGTVGGLVAEHTTKEEFANSLAEAKAVASKCVGFHSMPQTISSPQELRKYLTDNLSMEADCHIWAVDDVIEGGWSESTWNGVKELLDSQTLSGVPLFSKRSTSDPTCILLLRSDGSMKELRAKGVPERAEFMLRSIKL